MHACSAERRASGQAWQRPRSGLVTQSPVSIVSTATRPRQRGRLPAGMLVRHKSLILNLARFSDPQRDMHLLGHI